MYSFCKKRQKRVLTEIVGGDIVIKLSQRDGAAGGKVKNFEKSA